MLKRILHQASVQPIAEKGVGCTRRYDLDDLNDDCGVAFSQAQQYWQDYQAAQSLVEEKTADK